MRTPRRRRGWGGSVSAFPLFCLSPKQSGGGRKRWAGFSPQNPLDFAQKRLEFRPNSTAKYTLPFLLISLFSTGFIKDAYAFSSVLGVKEIAMDSLLIDGIKISDPRKVITTKNSTPVFTGYTLPNVIVHLQLSTQEETINITTDANGYWQYKPEKPMKPGYTELYLSVTDKNGVTGEKYLAASFKVSNVEENAQHDIKIPKANLSQINYLTVTLIVLGGITIIGFIYFFISAASAIISHLYC